MLLERRERSMRVGDEPDFVSVFRKPAQRGRHIVVEKEMLTGGPLHIDLAGAGVECRPRSAHHFDDPAGVANEDFFVVEHLLVVVEQRRRLNHRIVKPRGIDMDTVTAAEAGVAVALERGPRIDEREVDVEEDRGNPARGHRADGSYGPAMTTAALAGSSDRRAASCTWSRVTCWRMPGSRRS